MTYTKLIERADLFMQGLGKAILREIASSFEELQAENERLKSEREALRDSAKEVTRLRDQFQSRLYAMGKGEPVASIYISAMGREFDDWKCELPEGQNLLYAAPKALALDVDWLSNVIRQVDGNNKLGAGALAEKIVETISAHGIGGTP